MHKRILIAAAAALVSCGGSSWIDPTSGNFSAQDSAAIVSMMSGAFGAVARDPAQQVPLQNSKALTQSTTASCAMGGSVTVTASAGGSCSASGDYCDFNGSASMSFTSCTTQDGYVGSNAPMTNGLEATFGGWQRTTGTTTSFDVKEHIWGGITVTRTDGTLVGTCGINVSVEVSSDGTTDTVHVNGTVCKQAVAQ
jgi:hypothetical protein